jgi:hypothetical protein
MYINKYRNTAHSIEALVYRCTSHHSTDPALRSLKIIISIIIIIDASILIFKILFIINEIEIIIITARKINTTISAKS